MKSDRFIIQTISVVICLFLIVYVSFHSVNLDSQPYQTEVALTYTISDSVEASGVIIREEQLISGQASGGVVSYHRSAEGIGCPQRGIQQYRNGQPADQLGDR